MMLSVAEVEIVKQFFGTLLCLSFVLTTDEGWDTDVLQCRELGQELVKLKHKAEVLITESGDVFVSEVGDINAVNLYRSCVGCVECAHDLQQGGLSRSRRANDADHFAFVDVEVYAFEHLERAEGLGDVVESYHCELMGLMGLMG